jgi:hypothetical protein
MSARLISKANLAKTVAGIIMPTVQDVNSAVAQAVNALFSQHCRKVDAKGECVVALADPQLVASKFMQDTVANAYGTTQVVPDKPNLPRLNFIAKLTPPFTELLHGRLKKNVAMAIAGFVVASHFNPFPVTAVHIYRGPTEMELVKTAHIQASIPVDLPNLVPSEVPMKAYLMMLPEPVVIPPEGILRLVATLHPSIPAGQEYDIYAWIMWVPPIVLTSRSAYLEAVAPQSSPMM